MFVEVTEKSPTIINQSENNTSIREDTESSHLGLRHVTSRYLATASTKTLESSSDDSGPPTGYIVDILFGVFEQNTAKE